MVRTTLLARSIAAGFMAISGFACNSFATEVGNDRVAPCLTAGVDVGGKLAAGADGKLRSTHEKLRKLENNQSGFSMYTPGSNDLTRKLWSADLKLKLGIGDRKLELPLAKLADVCRKL